MPTPADARGEASGSGDVDAPNPLTEEDAITVWKRGAVERSRGEGFLDSEKTFLIKEMRRVQGDPQKKLTNPEISKIIENGLKSKDLMPVRVEYRKYTEKVRSFLAQSFKLREAENSENED